MMRKCTIYFPPFYFSSLPLTNIFDSHKILRSPMIHLAIREYRKKLNLRLHVIIAEIYMRLILSYSYSFSLIDTVERILYITKFISKIMVVVSYIIIKGNFVLNCKSFALHYFTIFYDNFY